MAVTHIHRCTAAFLLRRLYVTGLMFTVCVAQRSVGSTTSCCSPNTDSLMLWIIRVLLHQENELVCSRYFSLLFFYSLKEQFT